MRLCKNHGYYLTLHVARVWAGDTGRLHKQVMTLLAATQRPHPGDSETSGPAQPRREGHRARPDGPPLSGRDALDDVFSKEVLCPSLIQQTAPENPQEPAQSPSPGSCRTRWGQQRLSVMASATRQAWKLVFLLVLLGLMNGLR